MKNISEHNYRRASNLSESFDGKNLAHENLRSSVAIFQRKIEENKRSRSNSSNGMNNSRSFDIGKYKQELRKDGNSTVP